MDSMLISSASSNSIEIYEISLEFSGIASDVLIVS
jgi:hypothetical protein